VQIILRKIKKEKKKEIMKKISSQKVMAKIHRKLIEKMLRAHSFTQSELEVIWECIDIGFMAGFDMSSSLQTVLRRERSMLLIKDAREVLEEFFGLKEKEKLYWW
jgi:hypothetical protein